MNHTVRGPEYCSDGESQQIEPMKHEMLFSTCNVNTFPMLQLWKINFQETCLVICISGNVTMTAHKDQVKAFQMLENNRDTIIRLLP